MGLLSRLLVILLAGGAPVAAHAETLCDALHAFERTPLDPDSHGDLQPRSATLLWRGPWGISNIGYECRHGGDPAARALCATLEEHMPQEFRTNLPFAILRCYGYSFPAHAAYNWNAWGAEIELSDEGSRRFRLDVSMYQPGDLRDAIRLVLLPPDYDPEAHPLPSLREPMPPAQD
jgi:hypothetical protein